MEGLPAVGGGAQQEAMGTQVNGRASRASPLFSYLRHATGTSFKFPRAPTFNHGGFPMLAGGGFDDSIDGMREGALMGKGGSGHSTEGEGGAAVEVGHLGAGGNRAGIGGAGFAGASGTAGGTTHGGGGEVAGGIGGWFIVGREDLDMAQREKEALQWEWDTSVQVAMEWALEVHGLQEHLAQREIQPMEVAEEQQVASEGGSLRAELEAAGQRED
ncbi:hypothetical protein C0989_002070 [Termitomyces sp. Mn162]|nr:hypothetical protein C0989_002070 [Termitomyces sp. Mn162]